ncbi:MAG: phosphatidylserine decarboxylase [Rickettsiales bacterium]
MKIQSFIPKINEEGYIFIVIFAVIALFLSLFSNTLGWVGLILTLWCVYFFRDPDRVTPQNEDLVVSSADGVVSKIEDIDFPKELGMSKTRGTRVSVFLNIFDVHVNRLPVEGKIAKTHYHPGAFFNASLDKASDENERQYVHIKTKKNKKDVVVTQIAGLIARRIVCHVEGGQDSNIGSRFGLIRFGSRVDIYLPSGVQVLVHENQRVIAGETLIASLTNSFPKDLEYKYH